jgi:hypothetical protein
MRRASLPLRRETLPRDGGAPPASCWMCLSSVSARNGAMSAPLRPQALPDGVPGATIPVPGIAGAAVTGRESIRGDSARGRVGGQLPRPGPPVIAFSRFSHQLDFKISSHPPPVGERALARRPRTPTSRGGSAPAPDGEPATPTQEQGPCKARRAATAGGAGCRPSARPRSATWRARRKGRRRVGRAGGDDRAGEAEQALGKIGSSLGHLNLSSLLRSLSVVATPAAFS